MPIPNDYVQRVYAGVLGKIIGVYLGRPLEGWTHERILKTLGPIHYYVHEKLGLPLIVTDDDISGTFTFLRALEDYGNSRNLTAQQIAQSWLNYIIENKTILWWGGLGMSTEHTAFLRLKHGIPAPLSGSTQSNGKMVAEQIGAQIFIDGWALVAPGDPELAASLAKRAASVSHDGEAVYGAQVLAAMESLAFVEPDVNRILDTAVGFIPKDSIIFRMIADLRSFHAKEPDWRKAFSDVMLSSYGYDKYGGGCHIVPNHGLVILAILYANDSFQQALMIANTCGWDTDCNSGNVGCFMGIKLRIQGIQAGPDWRSPVADRLYLPTADGGSCITDAAAETYRIVNMGRALAGLQPLAPKNGARFHFSLPGSTQGWQVEDSPESRGTVTLASHAITKNNGQETCLGIHLHDLAPGRIGRVATATFIPPDASKMPGYALMACPTLYPGQTVTARIGLAEASRAAVTCRLYIRSYGGGDELLRTHGGQVMLQPRDFQTLTWRIPDLDGAPIAEIGIEILAGHDAVPGILYLDYLTWSGTPEVIFRRSRAGGSMWLRAWVDAMDGIITWEGIPEEYRFYKNEGRGLMITGTREWQDYRVKADLTGHLARSFGLGARVQGMCRFYAMLLCNDGTARLIKAFDGDQVLAQCDFPWEYTKTYKFCLQVQGHRIMGWIDGKLLLRATDSDRPLTGGGIALVCEEGRASCGPVTVQAPQ